MSRFNKTGKKTDPFANVGMGFGPAAGPPDIGPRGLERAMEVARQKGVFKIENRGLTSFPPEILAILDESNIGADEKWWECTQLQSIELSNNEIPSIPSGIQTLGDSLLALNMSNNRLDSLPAALFDMPALQSLDLSKNRIRSLPEHMDGLISCVNLNLSSNPLEGLPASLGGLSRMQFLLLNDCGLKMLPESIANMNLITLAVSGNMLERLPGSVSRMTNMTTLEMSRNQLRSLPSIAGMLALQRLDCSYNKLTRIPALPNAGMLVDVSFAYNVLEDCSVLADCLTLCAINLRDNRLSELTPAFGNLKKLKMLDVTNNELSDIPGHIGTLPDLNKLLLDGNPMRRIPVGKRTAGVAILKKYLCSRLSDGELNSLTGAVGGDRRLELALRDGAPSKNTVLTDLGLKDLPQLPIGLLSLDISSNPLRTLPPELEDQALTLRSLTADDIGLRQLPEVVLQLRELRELRLRKNSLRDLPRLSSLSVLHTLDISMNAISVFPRAALELGTLKHLFMAFNKIERVPSLHEAFPLLETLDLGNNIVTEVGDGLRYMPHLSFLNIENNNLQRLPAEASLCPSLKNFLVNGNPQRAVKQNVLSQGSLFVLQYLRDSIPANSPLLGDGAAPKNEVATASDDGGAIAQLRAELEDLTAKLEDFGLSQAKKYAFKKDVAMKKAALIRAERQ